MNNCKEGVRRNLILQNLAGEMAGARRTGEGSRADFETQRLDGHVTARRQLRESTQSLAQIAFNVGLSSQSHFTRTFKQHVGVTPGQYRDVWR